MPHWEFLDESGRVVQQGFRYTPFRLWDDTGTSCLAGNARAGFTVD